MSHTIRQQKMFDSIKPKQRVNPDSILEEMIKGLGALFAGVLLGLMIFVAAFVLWLISKDYFDYFIWSVS